MAARIHLAVALFYAMERTATRTIHRFSGGQLETVDDLLVVEQDVSLYVDDQRIISSACSPGKLREWTYGYLLSSGMIAGVPDVPSFHAQAGEVHVTLRDRETVRRHVPIDDSLHVRIALMLATAARAHQQGQVFQRTGGTHGVAICDAGGGMIFIEDISRTCAMEKVIGKAFLSEVDFRSSFIFLSSRIPVSMLRKIARCGIPIIGCVSAPTAQAVELADKLGICLCGFVRRERR